MINKYSSKNDKVKNSNWREADQLAIYKRSREVELGLPRTTSASGQNGIWTRDLRISCFCCWACNLHPKTDSWISLILVDTCISTLRTALNSCCYLTSFYYIIYFQIFFSALLVSQQVLLIKWRTRWRKLLKSRFVSDCPDFLTWSLRYFFIIIIIIIIIILLLLLWLWLWLWLWLFIINYYYYHI